MPGLQEAGRLDVTRALEQERAAFLQLLERLSVDEWARPTECPAWTVKGIALHVIGDDFSLLLRQRDAQQPAVYRDDAGEWVGSYRSLDEFNEDWVRTAEFFSPQLIIELLRMTGASTLDWYTTVDPASLGEAVWFYSEDPTPYWMIAAREHWERWIHQNQIRRATGRPELDDPVLLMTVIATVVRAFPHAFRALRVDDGCTVGVSVDRMSDWTVQRERGAWRLYEGDDDETVDVRLSVTRESATPLFSRGLTPDEIGRAVNVQGDPTIGGLIVAGLGAALGRGETTAAAADR
jgi:uncharacterized protein (TIGR03083 family)